MEFHVPFCHIYTSGTDTSHKKSEYSSPNKVCQNRVLEHDTGNPIDRVLPVVKAQNRSVDGHKTEHALLILLLTSIYLL
jgi:hypothetical protein